eukprot:UN24180
MVISIIFLDKYTSIATRRRRRSVPFLHGRSGGQSPPSKFYKLFCRYPPLVFWKIDKQGERYL